MNEQGRFRIHEFDVSELILDASQLRGLCQQWNNDCLCLETLFCVLQLKVACQSNAGFIWESNAVSFFCSRNDRRRLICDWLFNRHQTILVRLMCPCCGRHPRVKRQTESNTKGVLIKWLITLLGYCLFHLRLCLSLSVRVCLSSLSKQKMLSSSSHPCQSAATCLDKPPLRAPAPPFCLHLFPS